MPPIILKFPNLLLNRNRRAENKTETITSPLRTLNFVSKWTETFSFRKKERFKKRNESNMRKERNPDRMDA